MWVSIGNAGTPYACDITTLAVLCPTPASDSRKSQSGTSSPPASMIWLAAVHRLRAFVGARPTSRMCARIRSGPSAAIRSGVSASANSAGVTWLTFLSVVWADRATATSRVYGSRWSSGIGGSGYRSSRTSPMRSAFSCRRTAATVPPLPPPSGHSASQTAIWSPRFSISRTWVTRLPLGVTGADGRRSTGPLPTAAPSCLRAIRGHAVNAGGARRPRRRRWRWRDRRGDSTLVRSGCRRTGLSRLTMLFGSSPA